MILTPRTYPSLELYRWPKSPRTLGFRFWIGSEVFEFGVENSNLEWCFQVRSGVLEFGVAFSNSEWRFQIRSGVFESGVIFSNWKWCFRIRRGVLKLGVKFSNSKWSFRTRSEVLEFGVNFYNQEWTLRIRSELLELRWTFRIIVGIRSMFKDKDCHLEFGVHFWATVGSLVHHALPLLYKHGGSVRTCCCTRHFGAFGFLSGRWLQRTFASIGVFKSYYYKLWGFTRFYRGWHRIGHYIFIERREIERSLHLHGKPFTHWRQRSASLWCIRGENARGDGLHIYTGVKPWVTFYILALTSMSFRDFPSL